MKVDRQQTEADRLAEAKSALESGGLVIVPTKTVYGITCNPAVPGARRRKTD